jgi:sugar/nucleoside kinase (ribokinase family)
MSRDRGSKVSGPAQSHEVLSGFRFDIVGVGALNLDYITGNPGAAGMSPEHSLTARISELVGQEGEPLEWGVERQVDSRTIHAVIEAVSSSRPDTMLGGSAFNAVHAIAKTKAGLRLGFVGVAGRVPVIGLSALQQLDSLGIDSRYVRQDAENLCGICFSYSEDGDRTLLTHAGANSGMADYIERNFDDLTAYLLGAHIIHVTSFLDACTAGALLPLLRAVKQAGRGNLISFDPGHVWSTKLTPEVEGIIELSDYLLLNNREFGEVGQRALGESDATVAERILNRMTNVDGVVIVKRAAGVWSHRRENGLTRSEFYAHTPLSADQVEDATGAGDVFAAGLLVVLASQRMQIELGALLGMRLARHKLRYVGNAGHAHFAKVTRDFIRTLDAERRSRTRPPGIFISHGNNSEWYAVQHFVEDRFDSPVHFFESAPWGGHEVSEALSKYLERCSLAVCVLTAEDFTGDGRKFARQSVIHEVGLFQGQHGFDRVVLLVEEGCDFVPHAAIAYTISFPHNRINRSFYQLADIIKSHGFPSKEAT